MTKIIRTLMSARYPLLTILCSAAFVFGQAPQDTATPPDSVLTPSLPTDTATAAAATGDTAELDKMVVTATRTKRKLRDTPTDATVITRAEIEAAPATRVDDLLMKEPGVSVRRPVGMAEGLPSDIIIRGVPGGFASTRSMVIVDGIPTNVSGTPLLILNQVPLEAVERIELVRGPFSCLYGSNAFSGVTNIITRDAKEMQEATVYAEGLPTKLYKYGDAGLWYGGSFPKLSYSVSGGIRGINNYFAADSALVRQDSLTYYDTISNYGYSDQRVLGRMAWYPTANLKIGLQARYFNSDMGFGKTQDDLRAEITTKGRIFLVGPSVTWTMSDNASLRVSGFGRRLNAEFLNEVQNESLGTPVASYWNSQVDDGVAELQMSVRAGKHNTLTYGMDYLYSSIDIGVTRDRATRQPVPGMQASNANIQNTGVYLQDELTLWDRLNVVSGARLDNSSVADPALSPKVACSYRFADCARIRASVGSAFRAPNLVETSLPNTPLLPSVSMVSNDSLRPEYIAALDWGADFEVLRVLKPSVGFFYNWMKDLISPTVSKGSGTSMLVSFRNVNQAQSGGAELGATLAWPAALRWFGNYTYTATQDLYLHEPLDYVPAHTANFGLEASHRLGRFTLSGSVSESYVSDRTYLDWQSTRINNWRLTPDTTGLAARVRLHSYWRTDASIRLALGKWAFVSFWIQNAFNAHYEESGGTLAPGRLMAVRIGGGF